MNDNVSDAKIWPVLRLAAERLYDNGANMREAARLFERYFIMNALEENEGHASKAAKAIGVHRNTLSRQRELLAIPRNCGRKPSRAVNVVERDERDMETGRRLVAWPGD